MSKRECTSWRTLWLWGVVFVLLSMAPFVTGWLAVPAGMVFSGVIANHNDFSGYISAMRQGAEGLWLYQIQFSPEPWQPRLMLPLYMVVGKLVAPFGSSNVIWFHVMRLVALLLTLYTFRFWVREALRDRPEVQKTAWIFMTFGGGIGWAVWMLSGGRVSSELYPDIAGAEWSTLLTSYNAPHYLFGLGIQALLFAFLLRLARAEGRATMVRSAIYGAVLALALGLIYVYQSVVVAAFVGVYMLFLAWRERRIPWATWIGGGIVLLPIVPLLFYYGYWVNRDPYWAAYAVSELNHIPPPPLLGLSIGLGLLGVLVLVALPRWLERYPDGFVPIWLGVKLLVMYVPIVPYSGRFTLGLLIPVSTLAAFGLHEVILPWLRGHHQLTTEQLASWRRVVIILTLPSMLTAALLQVQGVVVRPGFPNYMPAEDLAAAAWLAEQGGENDVVLAAYPVGNYLPSVARGRVFMGQFFLTSDFEQKLALVEQFWDPEQSDAWRRALLETWGITHVFYGTYERGMAGEGVVVPGRVVYQNGSISIYEVEQ